jgi:hypothetical protein
VEPRPLGFLWREPLRASSVFGVLSRARALFALAAWLLLAGCSDRYAPEEAPPVASVAMIPVAAPGATGVVIGSSRPSGVSAAWPTEVPSPLPSAVPEPLPLPDDSAPSPFVEPPSPKKKDGKGSGDGSKVGPLPKGVQL